MDASSEQKTASIEARSSVKEAVAAATSAAAQLAKATPKQRATYLESVATAIEGSTDELVTLADEETALGEDRLRGEVARTTGQAALFADVLRDGAFLEATIDHAEPSATPPRPDLRRHLVPLGPVAVFTASNFPFAFSVAGGDTASALAAGCPVVVKAHSGHPRLSRRTAEIVQQALEEAGAPNGALSHVEGREAGRELVTASGIRAVGFTGSLVGGRALYDLATAREDPIPFYGELGSINPVVVSPEAARSRSAQIVAGLADSFTMGVGQFCTKPGVVFVPEGENLSSELRQAVAGAVPRRMLTPRISEAFSAGVRALAQRDDVTMVAGDAAPTSDGHAEPVALATTTEALLQSSDTLLQECFGPAVLLVRYRGIDDLIASLENIRGSLTASIHHEPSERTRFAPVVERLHGIAGRLIFDGWPTGVAVAWPMHHGGPWPATTDPLHTSVGPTAIRRFLRPFTYQDAAPELLPDPLRDDNPWGIPRRVDGRLELPSA